MRCILVVKVKCTWKLLSHHRKMANAMRAIPLQLKPNLPYLPHTSQTYYGNFIPQLAYSTFTLKFFDNNRLCVSFPHSYLLIVTVKKRKFTATLPNLYIGPYNILWCHDDDEEDITLSQPLACHVLCVCSSIK